MPESAQPRVFVVTMTTGRGMERTEGVFGSAREAADYAEHTLTANSPVTLRKEGRVYPAGGHAGASVVEWSGATAWRAWEVEEARHGYAWVDEWGEECKKPE